MRLGWAMILFAGACAIAARSSDGTFKAEVLPILQHRCMPCHFEGGKVYAKLPFDRPAAPRRLGERLFTRIKDPKEQEAIRRFLAEADDAKAPAPSPER